MKIFKNKFFRSVLVLAGGTAGAQVINTIFTPIITRIYSPEEFGVLTFYSALLAMLSIIGSLKFELGIAIADDDEKAINVMALSIIILIVFTGLTFILLSILDNTIFKMYIESPTIKYMDLLPIGILFTGLYTIFTQWALRNREYKAMSKTKLNQSITQNLVKIGFGLLKLGPIGLILGNILGQSSGIATLSKSLLKRQKYLLKKINIKKIKWAAKRYVRFPLFSAPGQLLNTAGLQLPVILMTSLYGSTVIGFYGLAHTIVNLPMNLIGRSVSDVFYGEAAKIGKEQPQRLLNLSNQLFKRLFFTGLVPLIVLILIGPFLFSFAFGKDWYTAGIYAQIIAFLVFSRLIFTPITRVFSIYEKQKEELFLDAFRVVLVFSVFIISWILDLNSYWFVTLYTLVMSIVYLISFLWARKIIKNQVKILS